MDTLLCAAETQNLENPPNVVHWQPSKHTHSKRELPSETGSISHVQVLLVRYSFEPEIKIHDILNLQASHIANPLF